MRFWPAKRLAGVTARERQIALLLLKIQETKLMARIARHAMEVQPVPTQEWWAINTQLELMFNRVRTRIAETTKMETLPPTWWDRLVIKLAKWALEPRV